MTDARIGTSLVIITEKLYGESIVADAYFGARHTLADAMSTAMLHLGPAIMSLSNYYGSNSLAIRMGNRVMFAWQQMTFQWLRVRRDTAAGTAVPAPDYMSLVSNVQAFLLTAIPELPIQWNRLIRGGEEDEAPAAARIRGGGDRAGGETGPHNYGGLDEGIKTRWTNTGYTRTSQMTAKFTGEGHWSRALPKLANGKAICLNWSCKGKCRMDCDRFESHKPMGPRLVRETNEFMDQCQVARA